MAGIKNGKRTKALQNSTATAIESTTTTNKLKEFGNLEIILQRTEKDLWTKICEVFVETDYNIEETCKSCYFSMKELQELPKKESDFVKFSKILDYVAKDERLDYLWIFLDCWNLQASFERISSIMFHSGEIAPKNNQWPFELPTEEENKKFMKLLEEVNEDPQVYALYDISAVREMLGLSSENESIGEEFFDAEFEELCLSLESNEREGALEIYKSNGRDIHLTYHLLGIQKPSKKSHFFKPLHIKRQFHQPKPHIIWPNHITQEPAEILFQIQSHPTIIDIHYYKCSEATEAITTFLKYHQREKICKELKIITGKGKNSETKSILREHVKQQLKYMKIKCSFDPKNSGLCLIYL
uniref:Smr domain-containing protein n=1 Tax=Panagrolaimus sp. PS1159 TaxID=55785 RepID=A0AC35GQX6_9BILA